MDFTQKLVHYSNTTNRLLREYNQLHKQITSMKIESTLFETFDEIQKISDQLKGIQIDFQKQFNLNKKQTSFNMAIIWFKIRRTSKGYS